VIGKVCSSLAQKNIGFATIGSEIVRQSALFSANAKAIQYGKIDL
jgi:hypothetical protein